MFSKFRRKSCRIRKKPNSVFLPAEFGLTSKICKSLKPKAKAIPETKENKFPVVETWRENVDGKYWFPSYSTSDDELIFDNGVVNQT